MTGKLIDGRYVETDPEIFLQDPDYTPRVVVMRHAHGITLNPIDEVLQDEFGNDIVFDGEEAAREYLREDGFTDEDIEFLYFIEVDYHFFEVEYDPVC